jgi:hypothetical protein
MKSLSKRSRLLEEFTIDYLTLVEIEKASQVKAGLKRKTIEAKKNEQTLKIFLKQAILYVSNQIVK